MMDTNELINALVADLKPVRRLRPPAWRLALWLALALPATALVVLVVGVRPDLAAKAADPAFIAQQLAALATAVLAGWGALAAGVPGTPRWQRYAPAAPLALWLATLGRQCWDEWLRFGLGGMEFKPDFACIPAIALISAVPALAIVLALRRGARLHPVTAVLWGSLAAAALANFGLRLFHTEDAALMVIVWQFGSVLLFTALSLLFRNVLLPAR